MQYFVTSRIDRLTSAIELAEIKRLKLFDQLQIPIRLVTLVATPDQTQVWHDLGLQGRVINLRAYFQQLPEESIETERQLSQILNEPGMVRQGNTATKAGKLRLRVNLHQQEIDEVTYWDRWGFVDRRDVYIRNQLSHSEFFDDGGKLITRTYYNGHHQGILTYHYRGGPQKQPILTLIQLFDQNRWWQFEDDVGLRAYFLDRLAMRDRHAVFYSDREDYVFPAFQLMRARAKRYLVLHSAFTQNAQANGPLFPYVAKIAQDPNCFDGFICATKQEARDLQIRFQKPCYAIAVTYLDQSLLSQSVNRKRVPGQLIAVARLTKVKRLDHLIEVVALLHRQFDQVHLKIYGYDDSWQNYETSHRLHDLVKRRKAESYIEFCGYQRELTPVYQTASLMVLTSQYEGFSMAILEALSHGCPVVSYDIHYGPNEMIQNGINGQLITSGDTSQLYHELAKLLAAPKRLAAYGQQAPKSVSAYTFAKVAAKWQQFMVQEGLHPAANQEI